MDGSALVAEGESTQVRKELVSNEILERAAQLFAERGFAGTSMRDIADAMGLTRPALYYYYPNKEALLGELVAGVTGVGAERMRELRERTDISAGEKLRRVIRGTAEGIAASPVRFRAVERSESDLPEAILAEHRASKSRILNELMEIIRQGVRAGEFRPVNERTTAFAIIGMINWIGWWFRPDGSSTPEEVANDMVALVLNGVVWAARRAPAAGVHGALELLREDVDYLERLLSDGTTAS